MELRLSAIRGKTSTLVNVEGRLGTPTVKLLERLVRNAKGAVTVDLTNLLSADDAGWPPSARWPGGVPGWSAPRRISRCCFGVGAGRTRPREAA
jgi:hypothetical protein